MTATNHAITGATIGLLVGYPWVALPAAFLSHFVCDAIPHFDSSLKNNTWIKSRTFKNLIISDGFLCIVLVSILAGLHPTHWLLAAICAFLATSPDLFWINMFVSVKRGKKWQPSLFAKFASKIQWFAKPIGAIVEATWFMAGIFVLVTIIH